MAIDRNKPANSNFLLSAAIRANWQAMDQSLGGVNLLADPTPLIWPAGDAADPAHWVTSGAGAAIARETSITKIGAMNAKLTYDSATAYYTQDILPSGDYDDGFDGEFFSAGAWVYSNSSDARIGIQDGATSTYSSAHPGDSDWSWLPMVHQISASATNIDYRLKVNSAGFAIMSMPTVLYGLVPPQRPIFPAVAVGTLHFPISGTVEATDQAFFDPRRPLIVDWVQMGIQTAPTGAALVIDLNQWTGSWTSMYGGTKPQIAISGFFGGRAPDGTYSNRCFTSMWGTSKTNYAHMQMEVDSVGSSVKGADLNIEVQIRQFQRPGEILLAYNSYR